MQHIKHRIILMVELGDLREGLMPADVNNAVEFVLELDGIELAGIGANLACFGGIKPDNEKMGQLSLIAKEIEEKFGLTLSFVSGGNSANFEWFMSTQDVGMINNLRLGESIYLGCETLHRRPIPGLFTDAFTLFAEVIESSTKPSLPYGEVCQDVSGQIPEFQDLGRIRRAILGIGQQDVLVSGLTPRAEISILGTSSDHIIMNTGNIVYIAGEEVAFDLNYGALLSAMTSPYVETMVI
jgi:predicted amino acid racemase